MVDKAHVVAFKIEGTVDIVYVPRDPHDRYYYEAAWRRCASMRGKHGTLGCCVNACRARGCNAELYMCVVACKNMPSRHATVPICSHCSYLEHVYVQPHTLVVDYITVLHQARKFEEQPYTIKPSVRRILPPLPGKKGKCVESKSEESESEESEREEIESEEESEEESEKESEESEESEEESEESEESEEESEEDRAPHSPHRSKMCIDEDSDDDCIEIPAPQCCKRHMDVELLAPPAKKFKC